MLQSWANYLLGSVLNQTDDNGGATANGVENDSFRLRSEDHEDDWVLVVKESDGEETEDSLARPLTRSSSRSSVCGGSGMDESWFVTPPPCFTSEGPVHMETSPLENLLIEHPSMSVYHIHPRGRHFMVAVSVRSSSPDSCGSDAAEESENEETGELETEVEVEVAAVANRVPRLNHLQELHQQQMQIHKSKRAQKMQRQKACKLLKRGNLERQNKAREVNSRHHRQRRGERSQGATRSHANNNRKC